MLMVDISSE